jgi:hypothetical protein
MRRVQGVDLIPAEEHANLPLAATEERACPMDLRSAAK